MIHFITVIMFLNHSWSYNFYQPIIELKKKQKQDKDESPLNDSSLLHRNLPKWLQWA